jgi:hypothetical protein
VKIFAKEPIHPPTPTKNTSGCGDFNFVDLVYHKPHQKRSKEMQFEMILLFVGPLVGVLLGGGGVFAVLSRANRNVELKDSTEKLLADSVPQSYLDSAHQVTLAMLSQVDTAVGAVRDTLEFIRDITDGRINIPPAPDEPAIQ